jgi:hypothetical protein
MTDHGQEEDEDEGQRCKRAVVMAFGGCHSMHKCRAENIRRRL